MNRDEMRNSPLRVLQIVSTAPAGPGGASRITGPERRIVSLIPLWRDQGIEPIICYPPNGALWPEIRAAGAAYETYELRSKFDFGAPQRLARLARRHDAAILHAQGAEAQDLAVAAAAAVSGRKSVITRPVITKDHTHRPRARIALYGAIDAALTLRLAHAVVAISRDGYRSLAEDSHVPTAKLRLIPNGVALERYVRALPTSNDGSVARPLRLLMAGHMAGYKGWPILFESLGRLKGKGVIIEARFAGEGPDRAAYEALARTYGIADRCHFLGLVRDMSACFADTDLFVLSSLREGMPMAILEAMSAGLPVIASDVGGVGEIVEDGKTGFLVPAGDAAALTARIKELAAAPALRAQMGADGRSRVTARFSETAMLEGYARLYRALAAQ